MLIKSNPNVQQYVLFCTYDGVEGDGFTIAEGSLDFVWYLAGCFYGILPADYIARMDVLTLVEV